MVKFMLMLVVYSLAAMGVHATFIAQPQEVPRPECPAEIQQIPVAPIPPPVVEAKKETQTNWMQDFYGLHDVPAEFLNQIDEEREKRVKKYHQEYADDIRKQYRMSLLKGEIEI